MLRKLIVPILVILGLVAGALAYQVVRNDPRAPVARTPVAAPTSGTIRVLFIGNSFVYVNDLPAMLKGLAASDGIVLQIGANTPGGAQLTQQVASKHVQELLDQHWDHVVIQEQSQLPSLDRQLNAETLPSLQKLIELAARQHSPPALFETWGYRMGDIDNLKADDYASMQSRLDVGFAKLIATTHIDAVPVNLAWRRAHAAHPEIELWGGDGRHPALAGTYLAACVFYNSLLGRSPIGNAFRAGLAPTTAATLQTIATSN